MGTAKAKGSSAAVKGDRERMMPEDNMVRSTGMWIAIRSYASVEVTGDHHHRHVRAVESSSQPKSEPERPRRIPTPIYARTRLYMNEHLFRQT